MSPRSRSDEGGRVMPEQHFLDQAEQRGQDAGRAASSWVFDARMSYADYRRIQKMLDDGDPRLDNYIKEPDWLSGEWAGESISELLGDIIEEAEENGHDIEDEILEAYEEGAHDEFWSEVYDDVERNVGYGEANDEDEDEEEGEESDY